MDASSVVILNRLWIEFFEALLQLTRQSCWLTGDQFSVELFCPDCAIQRFIFFGSFEDLPDFFSKLLLDAFLAQAISENSFVTVSQLDC